MATDTKIQWCDSTVNPTTGCDGCELADRAGRVDLCYAKHMHERRLAKAHPNLYASSFFEVRQLPDDVVARRMQQAAKWPDLRGVERPDKPWIPSSMPRLIFISDMADAMSKGVSFGYLAEHVMPHIVSDAGSRHMWLWVTKQPNRAAEFMRFWLEAVGAEPPANLMWLTSITSQKTVKSRIDALLSIPSKWHGLSIEPLLGEVDLTEALPHYRCDGGEKDVIYHGDRARGIDCGWRGLKHPDESRRVDTYTPGGIESGMCVCLNAGVDRIYGGVDWAIIGGASNQGQNAPPTNIDHIAVLLHKCRNADVPAFVKQLGSNPVRRVNPHMTMMPCPDRTEPIELRDHHGSDWSEWPEDLRVREFPAAWYGGAS